MENTQLEPRLAARKQQLEQARAQQAFTQQQFNEEMQQRQNQYAREMLHWAQEIGHLEGSIKELESMLSE